MGCYREFIYFRIFYCYRGFDFIRDYTAKEKVDAFIVGLPKQMNNQPSESAGFVNSFVTGLSRKFPNIPVHMVETINKLLRTQRRMTQELNREPTHEEIAKEMEIDVDKVEHIMKIKQDISSLDASVRDDDEDSVLGDFIEDEDTPSPNESATTQLLKEHVNEVLGILTEREQKILKMRFGLEDGKSHTLEEVGQEFSVTRERIRQIEAKSLVKLRKHKDSKKLHDYIK